MLHNTRHVSPGICLIVTVLWDSGLGGGMLSTECHSSWICVTINSNINNVTDV